MTVARTADGGARPLKVARRGDHDLFHHRLADAHGIDRIDCLVGRQAHDTLDDGSARRRQYVFGTKNVGTTRPNRVKLERRTPTARKNGVQGTRGYVMEVRGGVGIINKK